MSCYVNSVWLMSVLWYMMQYESNIYLYVAWFIRICGLGLGLICFGLGLTENFWPHTFWPRPRPWPHPSLASLTSLPATQLSSLLLQNPTNEEIFLLASVGLFVCMSVNKIAKKLRMNVQEIFMMGRFWDKKESIRFLGCCDICILI